MYGSQLDEDRLISLKTFKSKVVPTGRRADDENVHSIVAVVSQSANLREVKTKKRAKPFYYVDFEVEDDSSNEALCVKLWGEVERFDQLKHELVQGVTIVLQSVVLHADFYRGNRLTIQEHRYGYSSCIYIVKENKQFENGSGTHRFYLDRGNDDIPKVPLFEGRFTTLEQRIQRLGQWKKNSSTFLAASNQAGPAFACGLTEAADLAPSTNSAVDLCLTVEAIKSIASGAYYLRDVRVEDLEGMQAKLQLPGSSREKFEEMLRDCLRVSTVSAREGGVLTPKGYEEKETITMLLLAVTVVRSRHGGAVDTLCAGDHTAFFGFNDARGQLPLADAEETSFEQLHRCATAPLTSLGAARRPKLFRLSCRLHEAAFADFSIHLPSGGKANNAKASYDTSMPPPSSSVAASEGASDGRGSCRVLLSRLLDVRRHTFEGRQDRQRTEVRYRDAVFSIGSEEKGDKSKKRARDGGDDDDDDHDDDSENPAARRRDGSEEKEETKSPSASFVYSGSLSASTNAPLPPSARTPASVAGGSVRGQARTRPSPLRDSQLSQLNSYFSQAQPARPLSDSQSSPRVALMVKDMALTRLFSNIPASLAAVCLAKEKAGGAAMPELTHNYAKSVRILAASIAQSVAQAERGVEIECVVEVLPRNDEDDRMLGNQHLILLHNCKFV